MDVEFLELYISYIYGMVIYNSFLIIGALCGILGQFGDLVASSIKRYVGLKDYSNLNSRTWGNIR